MKHKEKGYLLDTSTLSILLDTTHLSYEKTVATLKDLPPEANQWLCPVTIGELAFGVSMIEWKLGKTSSVLRGHLAKAMAYQLVKMNRATAKLYGELKGKLAETSPELKDKTKLPKLENWIDVVDKKPFGISENDIWIAAAALQRHLTVVSNDSDFKHLKNCWPQLKVIVIEPAVLAPTTVTTTPVVI